MGIDWTHSTTSGYSENARGEEGKESLPTFLGTTEQSTALRLKSTSIRFSSASSCMIIPEVIIVMIPSSMRAPQLDARMTQIQYRGSDESDDIMP